MAKVFVYEVEDIDAASWTVEVAVAARTRQEAYRRIRDAGLHKKQIHNDGVPTRTEPLADWDVLSRKPGTILRRRFDDSGWSDWEPVQEGVSLDWRISGHAKRAHPQRPKPGH
jgi:hypothetical protein